METHTFEAVDIDVSQHRERLSPRDVGRGVLAAHRNMRRLFRDSVLLAENGRWPSALCMAIFAHEEGAKPLALHFIATIPKTLLLPEASEEMRKFTRRIWQLFESHQTKNELTLRAHRIGGSFPPDVEESLKEMDIPSLAKGYGLIRMRVIYTDAVQGPERWSVPESVIDPAIALDLIRGIRASLTKVITPRQVAMTARNHFVETANDDHVVELTEWSKTEEAATLSDLDLEEQRAWIAVVDAGIARVHARFGAPEPETPISGGVGLTEPPRGG